MDIFDAIAARRSVRQYLPQPVPRDVLMRIVAAGCEAPTGCNRHVLHFVVVDDAAIMDRLRGMNRAFGAAPAAIVIAAEPSSEYWVQDASAAMQNMLLAAAALGYGGCWVEGSRKNWQAPVAEMLRIPEGKQPWAMTPIGVPAAQPPRPAKPSAQELTHFNGW
jgi:nitroreductase